MERHLLVTVSEQMSALHGVRYLGHFFSNKEELKITLFYTAPRSPAVWDEERTHSSAREAEQQARQHKAKGLKALEDAKRVLCQLGFRQEQIGTKFKIRQLSKVMDIIQEGEAGLYDAVVLGRRGLSWLEEAFDESVTKGVLQKRVNFPLWICRMSRLEHKDVLACVDGSDAAYRMVDHVGFILAPEKMHAVTLLAVKKPDGISRDRIEDILTRSLEILLNNGFPEGNIKTRVVEASSVSKAILRQTRQDKYCTVALGRTGVDRGLLKSLFMGSVSETVFRGLEEAALWISH
jgi:nucleotide-binding universal stress UspA family protein